jgi:hypothetical protein
MKCMGGSFDLVKTCKTAKCPLHKFRLGKNPAMAHRKFNLKPEIVPLMGELSTRTNF